jgi:1-aminocyclopropane-1-carboxylate deaminase/D-cysteine desulfhydrase-like pyridoxal-dependent ACC family enzyme
MDLSRFPRRRYTPFATPLEGLPSLHAYEGEVLGRKALTA